MPRRLLGLIVIVCAGQAHAERAVRVVADGAPFTAAELTAALRVRLPADGAAVDVRVIASDGARVTVAVGDTTRDIELGGRTGAEAARLVALAIVDLAFDDLAMPPAAPRAAPIGIELDVVGSATAWSDVLAGGAGGITVARDGWLGSLEVAAVTRVVGTLHATNVPVRACAGVRSGPVEVRAGAVIAPVWVSDGVGDQVTLVGGTASVKLRFAGHFVAAAGADAFTTQTTYRLGMTSIATPWVAPWVTAGMELAL